LGGKAKDSNTKVNIIIIPTRYSKNHMLEVLISLGANVNYRGASDSLDLHLSSIKNSTALHWAVRNENKEAIAMLLAAGADPNLKDTWGPRMEELWTPLEWANSQISPDSRIHEYMLDILQDGKGQ